MNEERTGKWNIPLVICDTDLVKQYKGKCKLAVFLFSLSLLSVSGLSILNYPLSVSPSIYLLFPSYLQDVAETK